MFADAKKMNSTASSINLCDRLILALDVPTLEEAREVVRKVGDQISFFKIGLQLQYSGLGVLDFASELTRSGKKVFLDSKIFDIGNTIQKTVENIAQLEVDFLTVHGDRKVIESAVNANRGDRLKILAVTVLTSLDETDLRDMGMDQMSLEQYVGLRARLAIEAGADGVIASGLEASMIRIMADSSDKPALKIVTPGIRPAGSAWNDQKRVATPEEAITNGADYLVVGRPILNAAHSMNDTIANIFDEIKLGLSKRSRI